MLDSAMLRAGRRLASIVLVLAALATGASTQPQPQAFLQRPDIHGDEIVFTAEGDLWLGSISGGTARRITEHPGLEYEAHFSPDGKQIAFSGQYDGQTEVYVMPTAGGAPKRLTYVDPKAPKVVGWTPDGTSVLFLSNWRDDAPELRLFAVPATGGMPTLLPIPRADHAAMNADGHRVAYVPVSAEWQHWYRYQGGEADKLWLADTAAHTFRKLTGFAGVDTTPVWLGNTIYFISERYGLANLCKVDPQSKRVTPVTHFTDYEARYPSTDGKRIVFQHGNGLAMYDPATDRLQELHLAMSTDRIHGRERRVPAQAWLNYAALGPTGKRLILEARGQLLSVAAENGDTRVVATRPGSRSQWPSWSPDGKQIAFVSDRSGEEQVWIAPAIGSGEPRQLTRAHKGPLGAIVWSPDGKLLAVGDRAMRIWLVDAATGAMTEVDHSDAAVGYDDKNFSYRFSPDSRWLTFAHPEPNFYQTVYLYDIAAKKRIRVTDVDMNSAAPVFDAEGKLLVLLTDRELNAHGTGPSRFFGFDKTTRVTMLALAKETSSPFLPEDDEEGERPRTEPPKTSEAVKPAPRPTVVDLDGLADRMIDVPLPAGRYTQVESVEGKLLLLNASDPNFDGPPSGNDLISFDIKKKKATTIASGLTGFGVSADGKKLLLRKGKELTVVDAGTGPVAADTTHVALGSITLDVQPAAEWRQIFEESWRLARDLFYDPNMHGVDWSAVRRKYEAQLPAVGSRSDLNVILGNMIAELNVGHAYVGGGDDGVAVPRESMGFLGVDAEPVPGANAVRITRLLPGDGWELADRSPLLEPGLVVKEGDYIVAIGGQPVRADQDMQALLIGTAGQVTTVTINSKPSLGGAREVRVKPLASESQARYYAWVASRREYVRTHGGENLGYVHIPNMGNGGLREFAKHYYPNLGKDGIIFDVRNNGGGSISGMLLLQMSSKPYSYFKFREGGSWPRVEWGFPGYSVDLCNEHSGSNAEEFSDAFQRLKLGPVIGVRTWGGLVGSGGGYPLIDGGAIYIPNYGAWSLDRKWIVEGSGVHPDEVVEQDPAAVMAGRDPQLDHAIGYLKERIAQEPVPRPEPPPFPIKAAKVEVGKR